jgi:hypothetical protein
MTWWPGRVDGTFRPAVWLAAVKWRAPGIAERLAGALTGERRERTAVAVLAGYVAIWTLYAAIAKSSQDLHFDMGEAVAWSREVVLGTPKHPPLSAWLAKLWFAVFPLTDWAYYLLAVTVAGVALWIAWVIAGHYLDPVKRAAGLALLTLVPFFNFLGLKYNANSVLMPVWAATTLWFLRSFATRRLVAAALAGLAAAGAMLGKYWSITLLIGIAVAALADPRRRDYFRSGAPWVSIAVGILALAPHAVWLAANHFSAFDYALSTHRAGIGAAVLAAVGFVAGALAYMALPTLLAFAEARSSPAAILDTLWPPPSDRRLVALVFWAPLLVAGVAGIAAGSEIVPLWAMPALTLMPVVLLSSPLVVLSGPALSRIIAVALALPIAATVLAPAIAIAIHVRGVPNHATHYRLLARAVETVWRETTDAPLRLFGSETNLMNGVAFYLLDRPSTLHVPDPRVTPWADDERVAREGVALACASKDRTCVVSIEALAARGPPGRRVEVELTRHYFGIRGVPERYLIITVSPRSAPDRKR